MRDSKWKGRIVGFRPLPRPDQSDVVGECSPQTLIANGLRDWGYFPDVSGWHPGDLILTKPAEPDVGSKLISLAQQAGYADYAEWTHAAVYLGDGLMLCEAQFDPPHDCEVIVTELANYVGTHTLMVKRSHYAAEKELGWAIATAAATKIGSKYDISFVLDVGAQMSRGHTLEDGVELPPSSDRAFLCSTLYTTAHAYATNVAISDKLLKGSCFPAFLAGLYEPYLFDVPLRWRKIRRPSR